jgi:hypothetical protein
VKRQGGPPHHRRAEEAAEERQRPAHGDQHAEPGAREDQREHQRELQRHGDDLEARRLHEAALGPEGVEVDRRRDAHGGQRAEAERSGARLARQLAVEDQSRDQEAGGGYQHARRHADRGVQARGRGEHTRPLAGLGGGRHRTHGGARHAVAQHQQVARERCRQAICPQLRDGQTAGQHGHDDQQGQEATGLGDLLHERPGGEQASLAGPRPTVARPRNPGCMHGL